MHINHYSNYRGSNYKINTANYFLLLCRSRE